MVQTILVALGIIVLMGLAIGLFIVYGRATARRKKNELSELFKHVVFNHSLNITTKDVFANRLMAIDEEKKMLLHIDNSEGGKVHLIKLKDVAQCSVVSGDVRGKQTSGSKGKHEDHSKDISIALVLRNRSTINLAIYNEMVDGPLHRPQLMKLAKAWQARITSMSDRALQLVTTD